MPTRTRDPVWRFERRELGQPSERRDTPPGPVAEPLTRVGETLWLGPPGDGGVSMRAPSPATESPAGTGRWYDEGLSPGAGDVVAVLDERGTLVSLSPNTAPLLGFEVGELLGQRGARLVHPQDLRALSGALRAFVDGASDHLSTAQRLRHKHLGYARVETTIRADTALPGRRPAGAVVLARPAPEAQPMAIPWISLAPVALGTAFARIPPGSSQARIASADPVFASLTGVTVAGLLDRPLEEVIDPRDPAAGARRLGALLSGCASSLEVGLSGPAGRALELTVSLLPPDGQSGRVVIHARDVSRRQEAERSLQESVAELRRSNRELESFASVAAHDLAAPLRVVSGYADLLARQGDLASPRVVELVGKVAATSRRMQAQVDGLLMLARIEREELATSSHHIGALIEEALEPLADEVARGQARVSIGPQPVVTCQATSIIQVFQNLISNALRHAGPAPRVSVEAEREDQAWRFSVRDRGPGVAPEAPEELFELFRRGPATPAPGAGIGLAICRRIVERHGGRIWCRPRPGGGAEFSFTLPDPRPEPAP